MTPGTQSMTHAPIPQDHRTQVISSKARKIKVRRPIHSSCLLALASLVILGCVRDDKFPTLRDQFAWPIDIAAHEGGEYFYVLNADGERQYNKGSIVTLSAEGNKVGALGTPRLGRSLDIAGSVMIASYGGDEDAPNSLQIFDVSDPAAPILAKTFELADTCIPLATVVRKDYPYFAMSCSVTDILDQSGQLYIGVLDFEDLAASELYHVRDLDRTRRALHIDTSRNALLAFPSDPKREIASDFIADDIISYDPVSTEIIENQANEIPDAMESTVRSRERISDQRVYQVLVYDIAKAAAENFPLVAKNSKEADLEYRWIYYTGTNSDGIPDLYDTTFSNPQQKHYRTNFWSAVADPDDTSAFYLSHRNRPSSARYANDVIKVTITGDLFQAQANARTDLAPTADYLHFERVYGFNQEVKDWHYPGDIEIARVQGTKLLFVNHFRDLVKWPRDQVFFGVAAKSLDGVPWYREVTDTSAFASYYQLAVNNDGVMMSCSFYGNSVIRLAVTPGADTISTKRID